MAPDGEKADATTTLSGPQKGDFIAPPPVSDTDERVDAVHYVGDIVADFFCGGGTTAAVAQRSGRRWIAFDQSRVAAAITMARIACKVQDDMGGEGLWAGEVDVK